MSNGNSTVTLQGNDSVISLAGVLDFDSVVPVLPQLKQALQAVDKPVIDLAGITYTNSAGLALLLEALRSKPEGQLSFQSIPQDMLRIAHMCGLQDVIKA